MRQEETIKMILMPYLLINWHFAVPTPGYLLVRKLEITLPSRLAPSAMEEAVSGR